MRLATSSTVTMCSAIFACYIARHLLITQRQRAANCFGAGVAAVAASFGAFAYGRLLPGIWHTAFGIIGYILLTGGLLGMLSGAAIASCSKKDEMPARPPHTGGAPPQPDLIASICGYANADDSQDLQESLGTRLRRVLAGSDFASDFWQVFAR